MRCLGLGAVALLAALASAWPTPAAAADGPFTCSPGEVRARPGLDRRVDLRCTAGATLAVETQPAQAWVGEPSADPYGRVSLRVDAAADAAGTDTVVLRVTDGAASSLVPLTLRYVPLSQRSAPTCSGSAAIDQWTDGRSPAAVEIDWRCADPDGDTVSVVTDVPGGTDAPRNVTEALQPTATWIHLAATAGGEELLRFHAVDDTGQSSGAYAVPLRFGPHVDRKPYCGGNGGNRIRTRPGRAVYFSFWCHDADGDLPAPVIAEPPAHGRVEGFALSTFDPFDTSGRSQWANGVYVPATADGRPDVIGVAASAGGAIGGVTPLSVDPLPPSENTAPWCWPHGWIERQADGALVTRATCVDEEGDPLHVELARPPRNGSVAAPAIVEHTLTANFVEVRYQPGTAKYDDLAVRVRDDFGGEYEQEIVFDASTFPGGEFPTIPTPPAWLAAQMAPRQATPPKSPSRALARRSLGTRDVRLLRGLDGVDVWVPARLQRRALRSGRKVRAALLACTRNCQATGRVAGHSASARLRGGKTQVLWLRTPGQRLTRAQLTLALRAADRRRTVRHSIPVR